MQNSRNSNKLPASRARAHAWHLLALLGLASSTSACQARAKLIISDISSDARVIDIAIWKHKQPAGGGAVELIPSNPTRTLPIEGNTAKYRINVELEHNVEYSIFAATFTPKAGSTSEVCLRDLSAPVDLNGLGLLEAITDVSMPMHPVRSDGIYPSSACLTLPSSGGTWPTRKPIIAQLSLSSSAQIADSSNTSTGTDMGTDMGMGMGAPMDMGMGGSSADMGDSCTSNLGGPAPPPSTLVVDGWLFDPSTTLELTNPSQTNCAPLIERTAAGQTEAGRLVLPLTSDQVAKLRALRVMVQLSVTNSSGQAAQVQTSL